MGFEHADPDALGRINAWTLLNIVYMQWSINIGDELLCALNTRKTRRFFRAPYNYCLYRKKKITSWGHRFETFNFREKQMLNKRKSYPNLIQSLLFFKKGSIDKIKDNTLKLHTVACTTFVACNWAIAILENWSDLLEFLTPKETASQY